MPAGRPLPRRRFLTLAAGAVAATSLPLQARTRSAGPDKVIVIGAGVSGMAVARVLHHAGCDVVVLEARSRNGGRVCPMEIAGRDVDLGASWVHGLEPANPLVEYLYKIGVKIRPDGGPYRYFERFTGYLHRGERVRLELLLVNFIQALPSLRNQLGPGASVEDGIQLFLNSGGGSGVPRNRAEDFLRNTAEVYSGSTEQLDLEMFWEEQSFTGGDGLPVGGYRPMIEHLAGGLPIVYDAVTDLIEYDNQGVRVRTSQGDFTGSHAVVTVPLGVLQAGSIQFVPNLPTEKQEAIDLLGMGNFEKAVLRLDRHPSFENAFYLSNLRGEFSYLKNLRGMTGRPAKPAPTVAAFAAASFAEDLLSQNPDDVIKRVTNIVDELEENRRGRGLRVLDAHLTSWGNDPFALGSYSFHKVGSDRRDRELLGQPVDDRLLFAGEATEPDHFSTVHGALISGLREAERLLGRPVDVDDLLP